MSNEIRRRLSRGFLSARGAVSGTRAAIDLASIMVGVLVIGIIGGVIAATVFAVIPWSQDLAAQQSLGAVKTAQAAYRGLHTGVTATGAELADAEFLRTDPNLCISADGKVWTAFASSATGKFFSSSSDAATPVESTKAAFDACAIGNPLEVSTDSGVTWGAADANFGGSTLQNLCSFGNADRTATFTVRNQTSDPLPLTIVLERTGAASIPGVTTLLQFDGHATAGSGLAPGATGIVSLRHLIDPGTPALGAGTDTIVINGIRVTAQVSVIAPC